MFFVSFLISTALLIGVPYVAQAGLFAFVSDILRGEEADADTSARAANSQTMPLLKAALNYDPNPSKGGGDITVVNDALLAVAGPSGTLADIEERRPQSTQISLHVVREGETLSQIADLYGVTTNTIVWANDVSHGSSIQPGQQLVILPISGVRHEVNSGDTLRSIAKKYGGNLEEIMEYNDLSEDVTLGVGQVVVVPDGEVSAPVTTGTAIAQQPAGGSSGNAVSRGYYVHPLPGARRTQGLHGYNGVDLAAPPGTPIVASAAGVVLISRDYGWNGGYGKYVVIKHGNGSQTLYAHNSSNVVYAGDRVEQGQTIGYVGSTGKSTGTHVHFEIRNGIRNPF